MQQDGFYANLIAAISLKTKQLAGFAFVDDTDLCVYRPQVTTSNIQITMQNWLTIGKDFCELMEVP